MRSSLDLPSGLEQLRTGLSLLEAAPPTAELTSWPWPQWVVCESLSWPPLGREPRVKMTATAWGATQLTPQEENQAPASRDTPVSFVCSPSQRPQIQTVSGATTELPSCSDVTANLLSDEVAARPQCRPTPQPHHPRTPHRPPRSVCTSIIFQVKRVREKTRIYSYFFFQLQLYR